jgi:hypothetical protein
VTLAPLPPTHLHVLCPHVAGDSLYFEAVAWANNSVNAPGLAALLNRGVVSRLTGAPTFMRADLPIA